MKDYRVGDPVVYRKSKVSPHPGARARDVVPAEHGDDYSYHVDKYWTVAEPPDSGHVTVLTRTGKRHLVSVNDPLLHKANLLERLLHRRKFPQLGGDSVGKSRT